MSTFNKNIILSGAILASVASSTSVQATPFAFEARSLGMGNVSVATADIATAALANPAMLSYQQSKEDFSLLVGGGGQVVDSDGIGDSIDAFQAADDQYNNALLLSTDAFLVGETQAVANANTQIDATNAMLTTANGLNNKTLAPQLGGAFVIGFSGEEYAFALSTRVDFEGAGTLTNITLGAVPNVVVGADPVATQASIDATLTAADGLQTNLNDPNQNTLTIEGIFTTEVGLSIAKNFVLGGQKVSVGITPKVVTVERTTFSQSIISGDTGLSDLTDEDLITEVGDFVTLDLGVVSQISANTQVGLVFRNLIEEDFIDGADTISISSAATLGIAYRGNLFTAGVDYDLTESEPLISSAVFQQKTTQMLSVGLEFNAWDFAQLRVGVQKNMADNVAGIEDQVNTAGIGLWLGFNLDAAVTVVDGEVTGGIAQAGFKF